jgi:hypothetical protein
LPTPSDAARATTLVTAEAPAFLTPVTAFFTRFATLVDLTAVRPRFRVAFFAIRIVLL